MWKARSGCPSRSPANFGSGGQGWRDGLGPGRRLALLPDVWPCPVAFSSRPGLFGPFGPPDEPGAALGCGRGRAREGEGDEECTGQPGPCPGPCPCRPGRRCVWPPQLGSYRLAVCSPGWRLARPRLPLPERAPRRRRRRTSRPESARHVYIATQQLDPLPLGPAPHPHRTARGPSSGSLHALDCTSPCLDQGNCPRRIRRSVACLRDRRPDRPSPFSTALILIGWSQRIEPLRQVRSPLASDRQLAFVPFLASRPPLPLPLAPRSAPSPSPPRD